MASFSFGAGNAGKLAAIPLYALGRLATLLVPRARDEWVFGCAVGVADGALALYERALAGGHRVLWLTGDDRDAAEAAARGIPSVPKGSLEGWWRTARARVVVVTHGFGDANRYAVSGAFVVQLWHGIPLKRIGLDSPETLRPPARIAALGDGAALLARRALRAMYRGAAGRIRLLPAASHLVRGRLESAFGLDDTRVPVTGEPRVDVLSRGTAAARRATATRALERLIGEAPAGARLVLYAPTWRDGADDPAVPEAAEWRALLEVLERRNAVLVIRSHPLGAGDYRPPVPTPRVRALGSDLAADITPLLPGFDVLVTDYSSLAFDASLVPLATVFLAPDLDEYAARRGLYGRYADVAGERWARAWSEAAGQLDALLGDPAEHDRRIDLARALDARVHDHRDGSNADRVYRAILASLQAEAGRTRGDR
ncbi:CDP-glycerol glycerophosphotransferase family protein [Microbacterium hominis]|uniref:CDP-glycerol glycerophosphotransferase family protein n=1 Tax=Microbacterium hominis TaxID=162426 RepID=A0A7D4UJ21_9MICO|nr:CDP-glycerol glycerophosphotransferase family protein [Microbacterium hominis]QKJ19147.1 CDP-glycerol glycerophosphotransferase family protein [Microbacterium hominis]